MNPVTSLELERVKRLPVLKRAVEGRMNVDIYAQTGKRGGVDRIELVVDGADRNYLVVLGFFDDYYVLRSAYPSGEDYAAKTKSRGTLIDSIRI